MIFEAILFGKFKRTIDQQAAEIRMLNSQLQVRNGEVEELTKELHRTLAAADRQAILLNQRAETDSVIRRDLIRAIGKMMANGSSDYIGVPDVPPEVLFDVIAQAVHTMKDRGIEPVAVVMSAVQIAMAAHHAGELVASTNANADHDELRIFGLPVVRK